MRLILNEQWAYGALLIDDFLTKIIGEVLWLVQIHDMWVNSRVITLALILAGGKGSRLFELTQSQAKPALHFGGKFRVIDFSTVKLC